MRFSNFFLSFSIESACNTGWVPYGKSCYLIIDSPTLEWNDARRNCQKLGKDLVKITSAVENQFIYNLIRRQTKTTVNGAWLGLHRRADTLLGRWHSTSQLYRVVLWCTKQSIKWEVWSHLWTVRSQKGKVERPTMQPEQVRYRRGSSNSLSEKNLSSSVMFHYYLM